MGAIKDFLQGKWLKHSLHSIVVTLPLGLWTMSLVFDLWSRIGDGSRAAVTVAFWAITGGLIGVLAAVPTGLAEWLGIKPGKPARKIGLLHAAGNATAALLWLVNLILRIKLLEATTQTPWWAILLSVVGVILVLGSAYLGGRMVYGYGVGVARFSKEELRAEAEAAGSHLPAEKKG